MVHTHLHFFSLVHFCPYAVAPCIRAVLSANKWLVMVACCQLNLNRKKKRLSSCCVKFMGSMKESATVIGRRANVKLRNLLNESCAHEDSFALINSLYTAAYKTFIYLHNHIYHVASPNAFVATICWTLKKFPFLRWCAYVSLLWNFPCHISL